MLKKNVSSVAFYTEGSRMVSAAASQMTCSENTAVPGVVFQVSFVTLFIL